MLATRGLPDAAVASIEELIAEQRKIDSDDFPSIDERRAALEAIERPLRSLLQALENCDQLTSEHLDSALDVPMRALNIETNLIGKLLTTLLQAVESVSKKAERAKSGARTVIQQQLARQLQLLFKRHGLPFTGGPKGHAVIALEVILDSLGRGRADVSHYIDAVLRPGKT